MSALRTAVIGAGYLGRFHAQKFAAIDAAELIAVCDIDSAAGRSLADACGADFCDDYRELTGRVDAVIIAADTS
ncbi:MAG TPA: Gfo/Idh/MocA family oxidoreductase, partial [Gammaproteobacteria bacterium]